MRLKLSFLVLCLLAGCGVPKPPTVEGRNLRPINPGYPGHYVERTLSAAQPPTAVKPASPVELAPASTTPVAVKAEPAPVHLEPVPSAISIAATPVAASGTPAPSQAVATPATPPSEPVAVPDYSRPLFAMPSGSK
jgi:hypothetical protein